MSKNVFGRIGLLALAAIFIVAVSLSNHLLRGLRLDLTENRLYTLSDGTIRLLESLDEPINLYFFASDRATADVPYLRTYAGRVTETLQELTRRAEGRLRLSVIDPLPFSDEEDRATQFGLRSIELSGARDPIFLGIAATNSVGDRQIIPFLDPGKESFLEYELARLIYTLANPSRATVGLISGLPMSGGFDPMLQQSQEPWVIYSQIRQLFDLRQLDHTLEQIDEGIDVLMVVHPKTLPDRTLYAIDQFILGGGRALVFLDPWADMDPGGADPRDPMAAMLSGGDRSSTLQPLLEAWGLEFDTGSFIGDDRFALTVSGPGQRPVRHLGFLGVGEPGLASGDVITAGLDQINLGFAGSLRLAGEGSARLEPLLLSSELAGPVPAFQLAFTADPDRLRDDFHPTGEPHVLAARLTGRLPSAFPAGRPAEGGDGPSPTLPHLSEAGEPVNVVIVADTDLLADRLWVQQQNFFGQRLTTAFASNGDFVISALDNLSGSSDLISIRSRATFSRPFTRVLELRREAENRFRFTEQLLQQELEETEARLAELQAGREDSGALILSAEQEAELERFRQQRLQIRQDLRQVQRNLDQSIEALGMRLKIINIGLMPALVALFGIVLTWLRRRSAGRSSAG